MTPVLALWYAFTGGCGLAVGVEAWRGRHAPAYIAAIVTFFCAYGLHFVPMLIAVPSLLSCGAAIGERRASQRQLLMATVITSDCELIQNMKRAELGYMIFRGVAPPCAICKAGPAQPCNAEMHS